MTWCFLIFWNLLSSQRNIAENCKASLCLYLHLTIWACEISAGRQLVFRPATSTAKPLTAGPFLIRENTWMANYFTLKYVLPGLSAVQEKTFSQHCQFLTRLVGEKKQLGFFCCCCCHCFTSFLDLQLCHCHIANPHCCNKSADFTIKSVFFFCSAAMQKSGIQRVRDIVEISFEGDTCESFFLRRKIWEWERWSV